MSIMTVREYARNNRPGEESQFIAKGQHDGKPYNWVPIPQSWADKVESHLLLHYVPRMLTDEHEIMWNVGDIFKAVAALDTNERGKQHEKNV